MESPGRARGVPAPGGHELARRGGRTQIGGMRRQGGGFGFVMLLVVMAIVFYIAMNNFRSAAPAALDIKKHNEARQAGEPPTQPASSTSASADSWNPTPPARPNLGTMDQKTTEHSNDVQDALSQGN